MIPVQSSRLHSTVRWRRGLSVNAAYEKVCTRTELDENNGRLRARVNGKNILVQQDAGQLHCLSNVCTHLKLPLVGRTALAQGKIMDGCIECPFHKTLFKLDTGEVVGEWAPSFPNIPLAGKVSNPKPLPVYSVRETEKGDIEVEVPNE